MRFDLLRSTIVCVDQPLEPRGRARNGRGYRVRLESRGPDRVFRCRRATPGSASPRSDPAHPGDSSCSPIRPRRNARHSERTGAGGKGPQAGGAPVDARPVIGPAGPKDERHLKQPRAERCAAIVCAGPSKRFGGKADPWKRLPRPASNELFCSSIHHGPRIISRRFSTAV